MAGYVRDQNASWTELRVHGVSGTPPESMLGHPTVRRVSGDPSSGFYRRVWEAASVSADNDEDVLEAYSWGGLTSGGKLRALWLLLIPFLLVNVAFYARPADRPGRLQSFAEVIQRLFALTITATLVLATANVSMDFAGWQCRPHGPSCDASWLGFLSWQALAAPGRRIALTALLPIAVIALLWWLAHKTWCANEVTAVTDAPSAGQSSLLENRHMWNSARPVRRLRAVHVGGGLSLVGILALAPFAGDWPSLHAGTAVSGAKRGAELLLVVVLLLGAASVVLACLPSMSDRPGWRLRSKSDEEMPAAPPAAVAARRAVWDSRRSWLIAALPWTVVVVDAVALAWISLTDPAPAVTPGEPRGTLPWLSGAIHIGIVAQAVFLIVMVIVLRAMRGGGSPDGRTPVAWRGYATAVLMLFGSALAGTYAATMVLAVAHVLGKPEPRTVGHDPLVTSLPYFWAAALAVLITAAAAVLGIWAWLAMRRAAKGDLLDEVLTSYGPDLPAPHAGQADRDAAGVRARAIAREWATATLDDLFRRVTGWFVGITAVLIVAACVGYLIDPTAVTDAVFLKGMANVGDWLVGLFAALLIYLGRQTYQNAGTRRLVGVIWDLGTFWPRAAHPLAPPCYAERTVPELINRVGFLTTRDRVVLSCHSQGAIIGAAVVNQLTYEQSGRVALLTYGAPLRRLYARFFPAYFGVGVLKRTGALMVRGPAEPDPETVPWRNLYRLSDPIGGAVFDKCVIDRCLIDPEFAKAAGDISYPQTYGHSYYPDDPEFPAAVAEVKQLRLAADAENVAVVAALTGPLSTTP